MTRLPLDQIRVGKRHRRDMGDVDGLAASIEDIGLINPMLQKIKQQELTKPGVVEALAHKAKTELAKSTDLREVKDIVEGLDKLRTIVGKVTGDRSKINTIAVPMVEGVVKAGAMLRRMERNKGGRPTDKPVTRRNGFDLTLAELGFTRTRAMRWQLASQLPDDEREALKDKILESDDGLWSLAELLRAAKHYLGTQQKLENVKPSRAHITQAPWQKWLPKQPQCDLLLTDPPYSTDIEDIKSFAAEWLPVALAKVKPTGRAYVCIGAYPKELQAYLSIKTPKHLLFDQVLVWTYRNRVGGHHQRMTTS